MINGVSDALKLAGQLSPVSQTVKTSATGNSGQQQQAQVVVGPFRHTAFEKWAKMTEAQHRISSAQVAVQAQGQMLNLLKQMLQHMPKAGQQHQEALLRLEQLRTGLCQQQPSYLGLPLLDHQLNLRLNQKRPLRRRFRLKSVKLTSAKPREEHLMLQLPTREGPVMLSVTLPANEQGTALCQRLNQALQAYGISVSDDGNECLLHCDEDIWPLVRDGLMLRGQGHRLPAGEARQIKVQEVLHWQDPREWDLSSPQGIQQSQIKVQKSCRKLEVQIRQTREQLAHLGNVLHTQPAAPEAELLQTVSTQFAQSPFSEQLKALLAQANLGRNQAKDLLNNN